MNRRSPSHLPSPAVTASWLAKQTSLRPTLAIILGSGFQTAVATLQVSARVPYSKIPGFATPGVGGHAGEWLAGSLRGAPVIVLSGRAHFYEGHPMDSVTFAVRALAEFGVRDLLLTNSAGGIHRRFRPGDFMGLSDHINFMGANPLRGDTPKGRERFVDLTQTYDPTLSRLLRVAAGKARARFHSGVYLAVSGPSYETPAEIRAFERLGADAIGMSTVPEAIVGRQCGLRIAALSCITNAAAGRSRKPLSHQDVLKTAAAVQRKAAALVAHFVQLHARTQ